MLVVCEHWLRHVKPWNQRRLYFDMLLWIGLFPPPPAGHVYLLDDTSFFQYLFSSTWYLSCFLVLYLQEHDPFKLLAGGLGGSRIVGMDVCTAPPLLAVVTANRFLRIINYQTR